MISDPEVEPKVDGLLDRVATLREVLQGGQRLLEERRGLTIGRARRRLLAGLSGVGDGLLPDLAAQGVVGQPLDVLVQAVAVRRSIAVDDPGVQRLAALLEQAAVRDLVGQGMLERVLRLREQASRVEQLGGLEPRQHAPSASAGASATACEQRERHVLADHGGRLEQALLLVRQAVDAGGQHRLDRRRHPHALDVARQA